MYNNLPKTLFIGRSIIDLPTCHSTNDIASSLLDKPEINEGAIVITSNQTAGKGQRGNSWEAEPYKNLTFSLILKPTFLRVNQQFRLNIAISLGIYDLLTYYLGEKIWIKWPNDIFFVNPVVSKKICGILIQNSIKGNTLENAIVGIGLNVNQQNFAEPRAISMANILGEQLDLNILLSELMEKIEVRYLKLREDSEIQMTPYLNALYGYKELRSFKTKEQEFFKGIITGVDDIGRLVIDSDTGPRYFNFKEVEFLE